MSNEEQLIFAAAFAQALPEFGGAPKIPLERACRAVRAYRNGFAARRTELNYDDAKLVEEFERYDPMPDAM